ncbi:MAG: hypothetical protein O7G84_00875 [Gammaproteobacteria bacterium]|nr:hypothetical protein [Gammaproteobacteria bacterium]
MSDKRVTVLLIPASAQYSAEELRKTAAKGTYSDTVTNDAGESIGKLDRIWFDEDEQALMGLAVVDESELLPKTDRVRLLH